MGEPPENTERRLTMDKWRLSELTVKRDSEEVITPEVDFESLADLVQTAADGHLKWCLPNATPELTHATLDITTHLVFSLMMDGSGITDSPIVRILDTVAKMLTNDQWSKSEHPWNINKQEVDQ